jgi:hypothetical protein
MLILPHLFEILNRFLQGNVVQKAANSLEMTTKGLSSELLSELKGTGKNTSASKQFPKPKPLLDETSHVEEDPGYVSRCSTPIVATNATTYRTLG